MQSMGWDVVWNATGIRVSAAIEDDDALCVSAA